jgi:Sulfotransferase domain
MIQLNRKFIKTYFGAATTIQDLRDNARDTYQRHYESVRKVTPPERLLEFDLKDSWRPLCEFLGKDVPNGEFPRVNEAAVLKKTVRDYQVERIRRSLSRALPYLGVIVAVSMALVLFSRTGDRVVGGYEV